MKRVVFLIVIISALVAGCDRTRDKPLVTPAPPPAAAAPEATPSAQLALPQAGAPQAAPAQGDSLQTWIALGNNEMDSSRFAEAIVAYQKALDLDPNNADVRVDMGTCYRNLGKPDRAIEEYQLALKANPRHPNAYRNSGVVYANDLHKPAEAIKAFEKYLEVYPGAQDAPAILAQIAALKAKK
jgi:tetratricopeptide (TPR) repeat protein